MVGAGATFVLGLRGGLGPHPAHEGVSFGFFADELTLFAAGNTCSEVEGKLSQVLQSVSLWCKENGMLLSTDKTRYASFAKGGKSTELHILVDGKALERDVKTEAADAVLLQLMGDVAAAK